MIYKLCIQYSWAPENVDENYTEALANLYRGIETYNPERSICTWIHIVTKRFVLNLERKRAVDNQSIDESYDTECLDECENTDGCNDMCVENYRDCYNDDILAVLDEMKPIHKSAILLREAGYSLQEIVEIEYKRGNLKRKCVSTIRSRLSFARAFLKKNLTRDGERILD